MSFPCVQVIESGGVSWDDIAGLETAKELIKEIVVWPMLNPELFTVSGGTTLLTNRSGLLLDVCWVVGGRAMIASRVSLLRTSLLLPCMRR